MLFSPWLNSLKFTSRRTRINRRRSSRKRRLTRQNTLSSVEILEDRTLLAGIVEAEPNDTFANATQLPLQEDPAASGLSSGLSV